MKKKIKQTHGATIEDNDPLLDLCCNKGKNKNSFAAQKSNIESLTLEELQDWAEELGIAPVDNRNLLIKAIRAELK